MSLFSGSTVFTDMQNMEHPSPSRPRLTTPNPITSHLQALPSPSPPPRSQDLQPYLNQENECSQSTNGGKVGRYQLVQFLPAAILALNNTIQYNTIQYNTIQYNTIQHNTYLLLAKYEVRTASYGPSFFLPLMAQTRRVRAMKTRKEKTRIHNLPYGPSKRD